MLTLSSSLGQTRQCCVKSALNPDAAFCNDCGRPLYRCMAHPECGALLSDAGMCGVCVDLELSLDTGAASIVREGGKLALPLVIKNTSRVGRPVFITGIWISEDEGERRSVSLPFERLDPQAAGRATLRTDRIDHAGVHQVDLLVAVATRYQWREERYVFASYIMFPVEPKDPGGPSTTINVNADQVGAGFTVYNPTRIEADRAAGRDTHAAPVNLNVIRADAAERELNKRGYDGGPIVPRDVEIAWSGFGQDHAPFDGPIVKPSGLMLAGRKSREDGNDVCLRILDKDGDDPRSKAISRLMFSLYTESGRFMLRVEGQFGLRVNGQSYERTENVPLHHGDEIQILRKQPEALTIRVDFELEHQKVSRIRMTRNQKPIGER